MKRELVFSYGSNLDPEQMLRRCPSARQTAPAVALGWKLAFTGWSQGWGGSVATLEQVKKALAYGAVWRVSKRDLERLDRFEGVPFAYRRVRIEVRLGWLGGKPGSRRGWCRGDRHVVWTYLAREDFSLGPSQRYVERIRAGYDAWGLDKGALDRALATDDMVDPDSWL